MNDKLLERYHRDPLGVREELEAAARIERARYIGRFLEQPVQALFGPRRPNAGAPDFRSDPEPDCCP